MAADVLPVCVFSRSCFSIVASDRKTLPLHSIYTLAARQALTTALGPVFSASAWDGSFSHRHGNVVGLMLCRRGFSPDGAAVLDHNQRCLADFWRCTNYRDAPLGFIHIIDAVQLQSPQRVYQSTCAGNNHAAQQFHTMTQASSSTVLDLHVHGGESVRQVLERWSLAHGADLLEFYRPYSLLCHAHTTFGLVLWRFLEDVGIPGPGQQAVATVAWGRSRVIAVGGDATLTTQRCSSAPSACRRLQTFCGASVSVVFNQEEMRR